MRTHLIATLFLLAGMAHTSIAADSRKVIETYANIAEATYADSLATAKILQSKVQDLVAKPSSDELSATDFRGYEPRHQTSCH